MPRTGDEIVDELSNRCLKLLQGRVLIAQTIFGEAYRELDLGPISITHIIDTDHLTVRMEHPRYIYTSDLVLAVQRDRHLYSSWPAVYEALRIIRIEMILDDLAAA